MTNAPSATRRPLVGGLLVAGVAVCLAGAMWGIPREETPLPTIARDAMVMARPAWHTTEPVNAIVYGTRGFDTFGETFILLASVVGVLVVARAREPRRWYLQEERVAAGERGAAAPGPGVDPARARVADAEWREQGGEQDDVEDGIGAPAPEHTAGMTVVVKGGVRTALPLLMMAGLYLVAWGYSPGGGFPGGAVVAGGVLLAYVAYGYRRIRRVVRPEVLEVVELLGAAAIVAIGVLGLVLDGSFGANFLPLGQEQTIQGGGILQPFSASELVEVSTGLLIVIFSILAMGRDWTDDA